MACHLFCAKPSSESMLIYYKLDHYEQTSVKLESKYQHVFLQENAFENGACKILGAGFHVLDVEHRWAIVLQLPSNL